ncbi:hypothetical protein DCO48_12735 [Pseudomonas sp. SDI]|nr:hypothetical protein DCO48_12735 [Pseudomonas sp. SDI]
MKGFAGVLLVCCCMAQADDDSMYAVPPKLGYPLPFFLAGVQGDLQARLVVTARDGKVSKVSILRSDDELFSDTALASVPAWQFKPMKVARDQPATLQKVQVLRFRIKPDEWPKVIYGQAQQLLMTCQQFSDEMKAFRTPNAERELWRSSSVARSVGLLARTGDNPATARQFREALARFEQALPGIEQGCQKNPRQRYVDAWPAEWRAKVGSESVRTPSPEAPAPT